MRCPGSAYEFARHSQQIHKTIILGIQNAHQWNANVWDRFIGILSRNFKARIILVLDSKVAMSASMHLLFEQVTIRTASSCVLFGKLLSKLIRMGIFVDGHLVKYLLTSITRTGVSFDLCCTQLKVRDEVQSPYFSLRY